MIDIDTAMGDDTQLGHASSLQSGQRVPDGKRYHGSPAVETTSDYCPIERRTAARCAARSTRRSRLAALLPGRRAARRSSACQLLGSVFGRPRRCRRRARRRDLDASLLALGRPVLRLAGRGARRGLCHSAAVHAVPRARRDLSALRLPLLCCRASSCASATRSLLACCSATARSIVHYMRYVGWNLNKVDQTGSNMGTNQQHDNPFLCDIGSGTMVSDGLSMINTAHVGYVVPAPHTRRSATTTISATTSTIRRTAAPARTACSAPRS